MVAPIWAISLAGPRRSSRASRKSRKVAGTDSGAGPKARRGGVRHVARGHRSNSSTDLASSSTNSGTPSVLATICSITLPGRLTSPQSWLTMVRTSR